MQAIPRDPAGAAPLFERACNGGHAASCSNLGLMHRRGDGVERDEAKAIAKLKRACELGMADACRWLADQGSQ
jgi:TPR repeat protein